MKVAKIDEFESVYMTKFRALAAANGIIIETEKDRAGFDLGLIPTQETKAKLLKQTATPLPPFAGLPLRTTSATQMRRTPELAAFGYVADRLDDATSKLWMAGFEHLRGRQIYPAHRQSFIFNPVEILGVATGLCVHLISHRFPVWVRR
jgi:hypothetical protein